MSKNRNSLAKESVPYSFFFFAYFDFPASPRIPPLVTRPSQVGIMTAVFVVLLTINLLKGGGAFDSPVGIECGSFAFWATSILSFGYLIAVSL